MREFNWPGNVWTVSASMLTKRSADASGGDTWLTFGANWRNSGDKLSPSPVGFELTMSPAFACLALAKDANAAIEGQEVILRRKDNGGVIIRFREDTGELTEWALSRRLSDEDGASPTEVKVAPATFASVAQQVDAALQQLPESAANDSFVSPLLAHPWLHTFLEAKSADEKGKSGVARAALIARLAERVLAAPELGEWWSRTRDTTADPDFPIPPDPHRLTQPGAIAAMLGALYYKYSILLSPADTWPAKATRELFYIISGNTRYTATVLDELYRDPRMGPIGNIVVAQLLRGHNPAASWRFARRALNHSTAEDFRRDWNLLFDNSTKLALIAQNLIRGLAGIPENEIEDWLTGLPAAEAALVRRE